MEEASDEVIKQILVNSDDMRRLCLTNKRFSKYCSTPYNIEAVYHQKVEKFYPGFLIEKQNIFTWKELYEACEVLVNKKYDQNFIRVINPFLEYNNQPTISKIDQLTNDPGDNGYSIYDYFIYFNNLAGYILAEKLYGKPDLLPIIYVLFSINDDREKIFDYLIQNIGSFIGDEDIQINFLTEFIMYLLKSDNNTMTLKYINKYRDIINVTELINYSRFGLNEDTPEELKRKTEIGDKIARNFINESALSVLLSNNPNITRRYKNKYRNIIDVNKLLNYALIKLPETTQQERETKTRVIAEINNF